MNHPAAELTGYHSEGLKRPKGRRIITSALGGPVLRRIKIFNHFLKASEAAGGFGSPSFSTYSVPIFQF